MSPAWRQPWLRRATQLSWDELQTRARQEFTKRLDAGLASIGFQPGKTTLRSGELGGKFFFAPTDLENRARLLREHLPNEVAAILAAADEVCRHRFSLLGFTALDYGEPINWQFDPVHHKQAPLRPWFKIDFLNFAEVGDHKIIWELSRHQHLVTLAKAWLLTHDDRYATELAAQWKSWQRANPYPLGINWISSLEVAFRSLSWLWVRNLLADCHQTTGEFDDAVLHALALNGRYIEQYLSTYFSPNTHLIGEAVALFFIGTLCPQIPAAPRWRKKGLQIVLEQAQLQVYHDGFYFEQSLYYHVYALDLFLHTRLLALRNGIEIPPGFDLTLQKMLRLLQTLLRVGPDGFGDDDGGRVFDPRRNRAEHMTDPLSLGAVLFPNEQFSGPLTEEAIWLFGEPALTLKQRSEFRPKLNPEQFPDGGIYMFGAAGEHSPQLTIDAGPQGAMRSGHGHADALSVRLSMNGQPWLVDSGTCCYIDGSGQRNEFRGTAAHNTVRVDGLDQAVPAGPFAWSNLPTVRTESWITGRTFAFFHGSHTGYLRLADPVLHRRYVVQINEDLWLVRDVGEGKTTHEVEVFWHSSPDLRLVARETAFILDSKDQQKHARLLLLPTHSTEWNCEILQGQFSPAYGISQQNSVLRCSAKPSLPAEHATIIRALSVDRGQDHGELTYLGEQQATAGLHVYQYVEGRLRHIFIFADAQTPEWQVGDWSSDARFLYYRVEAQRISQAAACHVSFIKCREEIVLSPVTRLEKFEFWEKEGKRYISPDVSNRFSDSPLDSRIPAL